MSGPLQVFSYESGLVTIGTESFLVNRERVAQQSVARRSLAGIFHKHSEADTLALPRPLPPGVARLYLSSIATRANPVDLHGYSPAHLARGDDMPGKAH